ncbi:MAG TPA: hypothetical protein VJN18_02875 [Polyangiaceae bacterium]|nr:hypothetical protein [Polyangiaceae bacterium]
MSKLLRVCSGVVRAGCVLLLVVGVLGGLTLRQAQAAWGERLLGFGDELSRWEGIRLPSTPRRMSLNGAQLELVSGSTALPVGEALDRLEALCRTRGGVRGVEQATELLLQPAAGATGRLEPRLRHETANQGVLACLDTGGALSVSELTERLNAFKATGDLSSIGHLRYIRAERRGSRTSLLFLWTEGAFPLTAMFPKDGDAPGLDPKGVARPAGAQRLLSGVEHGAPYSFTVYKTKSASPEALAEWYRGSLGRAGFQVSGSAPATVVARQGARMLVIRTAESRSGVVAALAELR